jgi:hypothetical protein
MIEGKQIYDKHEQSVGALMHTQTTVAVPPALMRISGDYVVLKGYVVLYIYVALL